MHGEAPENRDVVDQAVDALRAQPIPPGPDERRIAATLEALRAARAPGSLWTLRVAAALVIGLCAIAVTVVGVGQYLRIRVADTSQRSRVAPQPLAPSHAPAETVDPQRAVAQDSGPAHAAVQPVVMLGSAVAVTGHVYFHGDVSARYPSANPAGPADEHDQGHDESLVINDDGTLQNVVVSVSRGLPVGEPFPSPAEPVVLSQKNCMFRPHVVAAMIGQEILVKNNDPMLHSVHAMDAEETPAFNFAQPADAQRMLSPFQAAKTFKVKCDIHPWMTAWVRVFNHPYFDVTHDEGTFSIKDLPPGNYTVKAWHETLGVQEKEVTVTGGEPTVIDFTFEPRQ